MYCTNSVKIKMICRSVNCDEAVIVSVLSKSVGAEWNRRQLRLRNDAKKPISL